MKVSSALTGFGWLLVASSVGALVGAFAEGGGLYEGLKNAVPAGVLLALAGHLFTQSKTLVESAEKRSLFNLDGFRLAFAHAKTLLQDGNNDRSKWIEAARSLSQGEELAREVSVESHKRVLELERLKYRAVFHEALAGKSAMHFYGVPSLYPTLDEAAKASTAGAEINGRRVVSTVHELSEESIHSVLLAASWPPGYVDPLPAGMNPAQIGQLMLLYPELHKFLEHKRAWHSAAGVLHTR